MPRVQSPAPPQYFYCLPQLCISVSQYLWCTQNLYKICLSFAHSYGELAIDEIAQSISCLAHHGILVVNLVTQNSGGGGKNGGGAAAANGTAAAVSAQQQQQQVHFSPHAQAVPVHGLGEFMGRSAGGAANYPRPPPPVSAGSAAAAGSSGNDGNNHLSAGFGGYGSPQQVCSFSQPCRQYRFRSKSIQPQCPCNRVGPPTYYQSQSNYPKHNPIQYRYQSNSYW